MTPEQLQRIAEKEYPYIDDSDSDIAIRGYNQSRFDKRAAFIHGLTYDRFPLNFWERLEMFISNVEVNDPMSEEEKEMIISVCKSKITP